VRDLSEGVVKRAIVGVWLVGCLIGMYVLMNDGIKDVELFVRLLPRVWAGYAVVLVVSVLIQLRMHGGKFLPYGNLQFSEVLLRVSNIFAVVLILIVYFTSIGNKDDAYEVAQRAYSTVGIIGVMVMQFVSVMLPEGIKNPESKEKAEDDYKEDVKEVKEEPTAEKKDTTVEKKEPVDFPLPATKPEGRVLSDEDESDDVEESVENPESVEEDKAEKESEEADTELLDDEEETIKR
jgi:hypothetical protein